MIEIKFRLIEKGKIVGYERWNRTEGKWCYGITTSGSFSVNNPFIPHTDKDQYTDHKDRNLKEVYERDNVRPRSRYSFLPYEVYWDERACQFRLCANNDRQFDKTHPMDWADEVTGNAWENPELSERRSN